MPLKYSQQSKEENGLPWKSYTVAIQRQWERVDDTRFSALKSRGKKQKKKLSSTPLPLTYCPYKKRQNDESNTKSTKKTSEEKTSKEKMESVPRPAFCELLTGQR